MAKDRMVAGIIDATRSGAVTRSSAPASRQPVGAASERMSRWMGQAGMTPASCRRESSRREADGKATFT